MGTASADPARRKPVAIVTGATSGIGAAAADDLSGAARRDRPPGLHRGGAGGPPPFGRVPFNTARRVRALSAR